jgi:hypothetical protein
MRANEAQRLVMQRLVEPEDARPAMDPSDPLATRLALFSGFIARIKHAQLRRTFPLTLRLLAIHGADIAFFASIAGDFHARRSRGPIPQAELIDGFAGDLSRWLPAAPAAAQRPVAAMLRHESLLWSAAHPRTEAAACEFPALAAGVAVGAFDCDVLALADALRADPFTAPACDACDTYLLYAAAGDSSVQIAAVDALSAWVLSRVDGRTAIAELSAQWPEQTAGFERVVSQLVEDGRQRGIVRGARCEQTA